MRLKIGKSIALLTLLLFSTNSFGSDMNLLNKLNDTDIMLNVDITDASAKGCRLYNIWSVANRISPENGVDVREGLSVNLIRMLGGILKDKKPYYGYDVCKYNSVTNRYEYDFTPLFSRLDKIVNSNTPIQEIVLDQPDWAFQNGYKFVSGDLHDGTNFNENQRQSIYGNSLPPSDNKAYYNFIKEVINQLVNRYGQTKVLSWQFRIGSEIETPDHWYGTKQEFIDHYINMTNAIRSTLPDAKIGTHTRDYDFVYRKKDFRNYKGEQVKSFAKDMLKQLSDNSIKYNFWGISDYVVTTDEKSRDIKSKYDVIFSKFINDSHWIKNTPIDIMEYSPIVTMSGADKKGFINCATTHSSIIDISLSHQFYKYHDKGLRYIYRWGQRKDNDEVDHIKILNSMNGMQSVNANVIGQTKNNGDIIDAITGINNGKIDLLVYNYNSKSFEYQPNDEKVNVNITTDFPLGTILKYKILSYDKSNNKLNKFLDKYGDKYVKKDFDKLGDPLRTLTPEGLELYKKMSDPKPFIDGEWKDVKTIKCDERNKSVIELAIDMPSFSYKKIEIRKDIDLPIIAESDYTKVTDWISSGDLKIGLTSNGGGVINQINLSGKDIMGPTSQRYGRAGQFAARDKGHSGVYNPTQAGYYETLGTPCTLIKEKDRITVKARKCALWHGDGKYDFCEWENIGNDPYNSDGLSHGKLGHGSDKDGIDETNLPSKQLDEVCSEFDYYGTYENIKGKYGISIPMIRHYIELRFVREPGHCLSQFYNGKLKSGGNVTNQKLFVNDISNKYPQGVYPGSRDDMNNLISAYALRFTKTMWDAKYRFMQNKEGEWILSLRDNKFRDDKNQYTCCIIISDSKDKDKGKAFCLYRPSSDINVYSSIGVDNNSGKIVYKDNRDTGVAINDYISKGGLEKFGFNDWTRGLLNPRRLSGKYKNCHETYRQEYYFLYGTTNQIIEAINILQKKLHY